MCKGDEPLESNHIFKKLANPQQKLSIESNRMLVRNQP